MKALANQLPKTLQPDAQTLARANKVLPPVFTLLLVIACSYILSQITWALIPDDIQPAPVQTGTKTQASRATSSTDYSHITNAHLFGVYQQGAVIAQPKDAPDTRLNLILKGVLAATPMSKASAIISMGKNGKEDIYSIGDQVASATVKEIYADRVILQRSGQLETLRMPKEFDDNLLTRSAVTRDTTSIDRSTPSRALSDIRAEILRNPTSFGKYALPVPVNRNGQIIGYKLQPQGDRSLFDLVGLDPSDVIVSINGVSLNNPAEGLKALRKLQRAKQVNITVLRNGAEFPLQFDLP